MADVTPTEAHGAEVAALQAAQDMRIKAQRIREYNQDRMVLPLAMFNAKWPVAPAGAV